MVPVGRYQYIFCDLTSVAGTLRRHSLREPAAVDMAGQPTRRASPLARTTFSKDITSENNG